MVVPKIDKEKFKAKIIKERCNTWYKTLRYKFFKFINHGPVSTFILFIMIWIIVILPTLPYVLLRWLFSPETFWEQLAVFVCWAIVFGWLQVLALIFGFVLTINLLTEDRW